MRNATVRRGLPRVGVMVAVALLLLTVGAAPATAEEQGLDPRATRS